ncbi:hypothetical protein TNIN_386621 [Trichonephila inaurata madagascariensis]|uniref:Uncharacterized protein n=1 Tax=Trichonephila inaurata madagascariensis TaxID=2747483 RepID=A0A8X6X548_9ARAC|nr:hypothetical protein TNIN_386621 [Trichonephila inaurata madagascariensis]
MSVIYPTLKIGYLSSMGSKRYPLTFRRCDGWPFIVDRYFEMITFSPAVFLDARELKSRDPEIVGGTLCEELKQKKNNMRKPMSSCSRARQSKLDVGVALQIDKGNINPH